MPGAKEDLGHWPERMTRSKEVTMRDKRKIVVTFEGFDQEIDWEIRLSRDDNGHVRYTLHDMSWRRAVNVDAGHTLERALQTVILETNKVRTMTEEELAERANLIARIDAMEAQAGWDATP
jgi:hypothetical protein